MFFLFKDYVSKVEAERALDLHWEKEMFNGGIPKKGIKFFGVFKVPNSCKYFLKVGHIDPNERQDIFDIDKEEIIKNINNIPKKVPLDLDDIEEGDSLILKIRKKFKKKYARVEKFKTSNFKDIITQNHDGYKNEHLRITSDLYPLGGTLGAIGEFKFTLYNNETREVEYQKGLYGITNHHVLKAQNGRLGDECYLEYNAKPPKCPKAIGNLFCANIFNMDVAFIKININPNCYSSFFKNVPRINSKNLGKPKIGDIVKKIGLTDLNINGKILSHKTMIFINFDSLNDRGPRLMKNQILTQNITTDGDSGSIIWRISDDQALGVVFASNSNNDVADITVATPIKTIIEEPWEEDYIATAESRKIRKINILN